MLKSTFYRSIMIAFIATALLLYFLPQQTSTSVEEQNLQNALTHSDDEYSFLLTDVRLFDGKTLTNKTSLIVHDGLIQSIGTDLSPQKNLTVIDGQGKTLIPGLVDSHTHSWGSALEDALNFGVMTHLDMFTFPSVLKTSRQQSKKQHANKATLYSAGMLATAPGGHGTQFGGQVEPITDPKEAAAWIDRRRIEGSDYIKLVYMPYQTHIPSLNREVAKALIDAAHERDLLIVAHIHSQQGAQDLIEDGIDGLVHIFADTPVTQEFIGLSLAKEVFFIPTLTVTANAAGQGVGPDQIDDAHVKPYLSLGQKQTLKQSFPNVSIGFDFEIAKDNVRKLHQANVPILAGSDAPNPGTAYGATLHKEMELLVASGLSPMEALKAGTSGASTYFNLPKTGHIQEGMPANIILINGQPDLNISDSAKIDTIFLNGRKIPRTTAQLSAQNASINPSNLIVDEYLGDFEMGLTTSHGYIWSETSDKMANGQSIALVTRVMEGAFPKTKKSNWSLRVTGETKPGFIFPWSGAFLRFSQDFSQAFSVEPYRTIRFDIKGKPGEMLIPLIQAAQDPVFC